MRTPDLVLLLALALPAHASARAPERGSLEELLERLRTQRDGVQGELRSRVVELHAALEEPARTNDRARLDELRAMLVALGPESAPLLVERIDPGASATEAEALRARVVAEALRALESRAVTDALLAIARDGSPAGRVHAIEALATSPDPARVAPVLASIFRGGEGAVRRSALLSLAELGGEHASAALGEALADPDPQLVAAVLASLAEARNAGVAPRVLELARAGSPASRHAHGIARYYEAVPAAVGPDELEALVRLAQDVSSSVEGRVAILDLLAQHGSTITSDLKKDVRGIAGSPVREVREAALASLARMGDRGARRDLLAEYDQGVQKNAKWAQSWEARAQMLYRIGEHREALKDYQQALKCAAEDPRARTEEIWIGVARCQARLGKLKEAKEALDKAPISIRRLAELSRDPAFAELAKHPKYRSAFGAP